MLSKNTLKRGVVRCIIFKEEDTWYGVALEFNVVEQGDNPQEVMASLFEAVSGYVETARKLKMRTLALNQKPDKEYEELWKNLNKNKMANKNVYFYGYQPLQAASVC